MVFYIAKLRSKIETNKYKHEKVAIFFLGVKSRISKEENSNKKEALSSTKEGGEAIFLRESKTGTKVSSKILSIIFVFSFYLFYNTVRCVFVCSFVCLFVKCAYAREETCAISSFAGTCTPSNSTKRHKKREKHQKTRASSSFAGTCMPSNSTKRHKKREKQQKSRASSSFAGTCMPSNSTKRYKKREKQQKARASSSFAGTCMPSNSTKRYKKREKQQKARASSSFAGYSTRFRGTFSLFLARKTLKNDFTHWNIVQMKIFQGLYSRISRSERWVFFFWLKFDFFPLQGAFFCSFRPYFSIPQKQLISVSALFYPPETPVYYSRNTIPKKRNQQQNEKHRQHMHQKKATHK